MNYKSAHIDFIDNQIINNICADDDYYYFQSDEIIVEAEQISDEEFQKILNKIIHDNSEPVIKDPQLSNKEIIENQYALMMAIADLYEMNK